jgi:hypothetical protein
MCLQRRGLWFVGLRSSYCGSIDVADDESILKPNGTTVEHGAPLCAADRNANDSPNAESNQTYHFTDAIAICSPHRVLLTGHIYFCCWNVHSCPCG